MYMVEVYVDNFMSLVIPVSREQLQHVAMAKMNGIHDSFPPNVINSKENGKRRGHIFDKETAFEF